MNIDFEFDLTHWALPLDIDWTRSYIHFSVLCFTIELWFPFKDVEETPEEEFRWLKEYTDETMEFIAEERERINKRMGIRTR